MLLDVAGAALAGPAAGAVLTGVALIKFAAAAAPAGFAGVGLTDADGIVS